MDIANPFSFTWESKDSRQKHRAQYLDPTPINVTLCQENVQERQNGLRHRQSCSKLLEQWFQDQYMIFLASGLVLVLVEFAALLSTVLACAQIYKKATNTNNLNRNPTRTNTPNLSNMKNENLYEENLRHKSFQNTMSTASRRTSHVTAGIYHGTGSYIPGMSVDDGAGSLHRENAGSNKA